MATVIITLAIVVFSVSLAILLHADPYDRTIQRLLVGVLIGSLLIVFLVVSFALASAAENLVPPAPAESPAVAEKLVASCPTEFNPDDSAWALDRIESAEKKIADDLLVIEHIRILNHMWFPKCAVRLYSYGSLGDSDGKQVFAIMKSSTNIIALILTEKGWESGDDLETFTTDCSIEGCNLTFVLYRNKESVAARTIFIKQFSHFREPVE